MNLHPLRIPEGVTVSQRPIHKHDYGYTSFHPTPVSKLRLGENVTAMAAGRELSQKVWNLRTRLLPEVVRTNLDYFRQTRAAVKLGHRVLGEAGIEHSRTAWVE